MRLLHSSCRAIQSFISDDAIPPYAILSHVWGEEEVSFQDWHALSSADINLKQGYLKIRYICQQARLDGLEWVWVDTCCIDKTSSAELSEAINSMFSWYQNAAVCYAYLSDVPKCADISAMEFPQSRWFTRGWTLQELIAPTNLIFFSMDWHPLGTKSELSSSLSSITGIERKFLGGKNLESASTAKIMSWAALRKCSRVEDIAYCLLGLFDINMPLIYGEGKKAFRRLQEEIMKSRSEDHSLFAWGTIVATPSIEISNADQITGAEPIPRMSKITQPLLGLLATSPLDFASSGGFMPSTSAALFARSISRKLPVPLAIDRGVRLELPLLPQTFDSIYHWKQPEITQIRNAKFAVLFCSHEKERDWYVKVPLQPWGFLMYGRTREILFDGSTTTRQDIALLKLGSMLSIAPERRIDLRQGDIIIRRHVFGSLNSCAGWYTSGNDVIDKDLRIPVDFLDNGRAYGVYHHLDQLGPHYGFAILLSRATKTGALITRLFSLYLNGEAPKESDNHGLTWPSTRSFVNKDPAYYHVMKMPSDSWTFGDEPFPRITIRAERISFDQDDSFVDVIDLVIVPASGAITSDGRSIYM